METIKKKTSTRIQLSVMSISLRIPRTLDIESHRFSNRIPRTIKLKILFLHNAAGSTILQDSLLNLHLNVLLEWYGRREQLKEVIKYNQK